MSLKTLLILFSVLVLALISVVIFLSSGDAKESVSAPIAEQPKNPPGVSTPSSDSNGDAKKSVDTALSALVPDQVGSSEKDTVLSKLFDVSHTPTQESVNVAEGYLFSPDLDVRNAAIEAMKQLSTPAAARALRNAASRATSPTDKAAFLKAAEFVELPAYVPSNQRPPIGN